MEEAKEAQLFANGEFTSELSLENHDISRESERISSMISDNATFESLGLIKPLVEACYRLGYKKPTPIQPQAVLERRQHSSYRFYKICWTNSNEFSHVYLYQLVNWQYK
jgi:hypothetical protein